MNPVPVGVAGELYIGGAGVSRGYLNRPELTAERFIANPFATEEDKSKGYTRIYKTGDVVRWLSDGNLEYLGRNDDQVKIRGYRIELGEVEHALLQVDGIKQSCVVVKERITEEGTTKYLAGYYVGEEAAPKEAILSQLSRVLPEYMVPSALTVMERFPLTVNGKLDKGALPDPEFGSSKEDYVAPVTDLEQTLCAIWAELLGVERVGITDDFFRIGGDSILAIRLSHRMSQLLGKEIGVADVFKHKTIAQLLQHGLGQAEQVIPATAEKTSLLSFAQERLWFIETYEQGTNAYHMPGIYELSSDTDREGISYAISAIVQRHEVLRSTIEQGEYSQGMQVVHEGPLEITETIIGEGEDYELQIREDINRPFDLSVEYPLRVKFYELEGSGRRLLLINMHHIAGDGWSIEIFHQELHAYYEAYIKNETGFSLPGLPIQYKDYAIWQRSYLSGEVLSQQLSHWKEKLRGYQTLNLPTDYVRPAVIDYRGSHESFRLSVETSERLRALGKQYGVTMHSLLLSGMSILLGKYTGQDDIVTGSPTANRQYRQTEGLIGFFVNTQVNRTRLSQGQSYAELLREVHQEQVQAQMYQDLPFERLVDELEIERDLSRHPVFQVMFIVQSFGNKNKDTSARKNYLKPVRVTGAYAVEKFDLSVFVDDSGEAIGGAFNYATCLFGSETIIRLMGYYTNLLDQLAERPDAPYSGLSLLTPEAHQRIVYDWNQTDRAYPADKTIQELFCEQAAKTPDNIALVYENHELTYRELDERSNQLARHIRSSYKQQTESDLCSDTLIALLTERSLEMVIGILGVLKAGGAYVPIEPGYPQDRINYLLEDTGAELVLSQRRLVENGNIELPETKVVYIDLSEDLYRKENTSILPVYSKPTNLAYVIYTSGTTGKPKGVMVEHKGVARLVKDTNYISLKETDIFLQLSPFNFDASVFELYGGLLNGAKLVLIREVLELSSAIDLVKHCLLDNSVSILWLTKTLFDSLYLLNNHVFDSINYLLVGGEALNKSLIDQLCIQEKRPHYIINGYGPTEGTTFTTTYLCNIETHVSLASIPIGRPISNTRVYVLDVYLNPVPVGVAGELYIGGAGVSRGYLNRPELTAERFIANPFATEEDKSKGYTRIYKTGDVVRWLSDGNLEYLGRNDDQVKIRGYRIELGEVEHALLQVDGIKQSCVVVKERITEEGTTKYLAGYYVGEEAAPKEAILSQLSRVLPEYMVPSALTVMERFPLTVNGKLDKGALPDPEFGSSKEDYVAPVTDLEQTLCAIWAELLGVERVGITDDFFRIGGDSILAIQLSGRIRKAGFNCYVRDILISKTVRKLSEQLADSAKVSAGIIKTEQGLLAGFFDLLPVQQWFTERIRKLNVPGHYNQSFLVKVPELETAKLSLIIQELVGYHDPLRMRYIIKDGNWQQVYQANIVIPELKVLDIRKYPSLEIHRILTDWQSKFNLELGPLFQVGYLYGYGDGSARVYVALHHLIVDAVSWRILAEDIKALYLGQTLPLKGSSYRQWVSAVKAYPEQHARERSYWGTQLSGLPRYTIPNVQEAGFSSERIELSKELTSALLQKAPRAYHTEINDLLLTALAYALKDINGRTVQGITLEGHGREDIDPSVDHSHTVGWFTSMYPVKLELQSTLRESIQGIKEGLRSIPQKGIGFGAFAIEKDSGYTHDDLPEIIFNYLGQFDTQEEEYWQVVSEDSGASVHNSNRDGNLISINGMISNGKLEFSIISQLGDVLTRQLSTGLQSHLIVIIRHCGEKLEKEGSSYTPSDFKFVQPSQSLLDRLTSDPQAQGKRIAYIYPANSLQQGFIQHALSQPDDEAYRVQLIYDYHQAIDIDKYIKAWEICIAQYPILRTAFNWEEEIIQVIYQQGRLEYELHDISDLSTQQSRDTAIETIRAADRSRGFDLSKPTLLRLHIIRNKATHYTVLKTEHHIITDGWSGPILLTSVHGYYQDLIAGKAIRMREDTAYPSAQEYIAANKSGINAYWDKTLATVDTANDINALLSKPIALDDYRQVEQAAISIQEISGDKYTELKQFSQREGITINVIVQFLWHKLLQVYSGSKQTIIGTTVSGRDLPVEGIEQSVGLYINTLPLLINWDNDNYIVSQLQYIQEQINELSMHSFANLAKLQKKGRRLFHTLLVFENYPVPKGDSEIALQISLRNYVDGVDYPLSLLAYEHNNSLGLRLQYDINYLTVEKAEQHLFTLTNILEQVIRNPEQSHRQLSLLTPEAHQRIVYDWNQTDRAYPADKTIQELFCEQAAKTPDNIALVYENHELTYRELDERSNQLARHIRSSYKQQTESDLCSDTLIALLTERSLEMVIGILGVLKAGGAYVPIEPGYPQDRINYLLEDTGAELVLSQRRLVENGNIELPETKVVYIDLSEDLYRKENTSILPVYSKPTNLAYVIYTSGTTGKPKGVMVEHKSYLQLNSANNFDSVYINRTLWTNYTFDVSVFEIFSALLQGSHLFILNDNIRYDSENLFHFINHEKIEYSYIPPFYIKNLTDYLQKKSLPHFYRILTGVDKVYVADINKIISKNITILNGYGPTETTICSTRYLVENQIISYNYQLPIGRPISNTRVYVLDVYLNPVPVGVAGELYIGGAGVSRGYLNRPELTAERFIANPFATEEDKSKGYTRIYKTGDVVRWLSDGNLEYLGRNDDQVKIRGYRIELGEVEHALLQVDGIKQSCVVVKERITEEGTTKYLAGYYVGEEAAPKEAILSQLSRVLPEYMVPSALTVMERFPLTVNGKLDKGALPDPEFGSSKEDYVAPVTDLEQTLCAIWAELLGVERVGITDDFFRIGGDSILAIRLSHRMSQLLGKEIGVADVFKHKTIAQLLQHGLGQAEQVIPATAEKTSLLSFAQERLWFIETYEQGTNAYHMPGIYELSSDTDREGISYAISAIVQRHEVLRSTIEQGEYSQGMQVVHEGPLEITETIIGEGEDYELQIREDINRPFDLSVEYPLRVKFYELEGSGRRLLLINMHHIAGDGWSIEIFHQELHAYYEAYIKNETGFSLPGLPIQYKDYAIWQRSYLSGEVLSQQLSHWKEKLRGYQTLNLPTDYVRPAVIDYRGSHESFRLSVETSERLRALGKQYGVTMHSLLLSGMSILLGKYTGQDDIVTGSPTANRQYRQTEGLIGFFVNTQVNRTRLSQGQSYAELLREVHQEQVQAQMYQDLPFERLVDELEIERDLSRHPVFQVMFIVQSFGNKNKDTSARKNYLKPVRVTGAYAVEKFDLSVFVDDSGEAIGGAFNYATCLFGSETIIRLMGYYTNLLDQLAERPDAPYSGLSLLTPEAHQRIVYDWNQTDRAYPADKTIQELFCEQAAKTPDNIALVYENHELTYRELDERSNQLARHIRSSYKQQTESDLCSDTLIALLTERSLEMVIGILGVLKAGGAYVPIEPGYPQDRINYLLEDTGAELVLSQRRLVENGNIELPETKVVYIDLSEDLYRKENTSILPVYSKPTNLAYVIYTSGTTGKPKGVMVEHKGVVNTFNNLYDIYNKSFKVTAYTSYVFDVSVSEIFTSLLQGIELHILGDNIRLDSIALSDYFIDNKINLVYLPPVLLSQLSQKNYPNLNILIYAGEPCDKQTAKLWSSKVKLFNYYGPTESSIYAVFKQILNDEVEHIGRPISNTRVYVLDVYLNPVPVGVAGELYIGGAGVSRGYLNRPELTAERFIANPFATEEDKSKGYTRIYKTGDVVRWLSDGNLEYLGRNDDQVKIRGYRIELGEVEHALLQVDGIKQSCVVVKERITEEGTTKYLAGYYVGEEAAPKEAILSQLSRVLPEYMVPSALTVMERFPLTVNGKLDKGALPDPEFGSSKEDYVAPVTDLEQTLCAIWAELLGVERVGITDDFFRIGGDSILAIKVISHVKKILSTEVTIKELFQNTTIERLSILIQSEINTHVPLNNLKKKTFLDINELYETTSSQKWIYQLYKSGNYNPMNGIIQKELFDVNERALTMAVDTLVARHESLRTVFLERKIEKTKLFTLLFKNNIEILQKIYPENHFKPNLSIENICDQKNKEEQLRIIIENVSNYSFDFQKEQSFKCKLVKYTKKRYFFIFVIDHMFKDAQTLKIIESEIFTIYADYCKGLPHKIEKAKLQFKDYAIYHNDHLRGKKLLYHYFYYKKFFKNIPPIFKIKSIFSSEKKWN